MYEPLDSDQVAFSHGYSGMILPRPASWQSLEAFSSGEFEMIRYWCCCRCWSWWSCCRRRRYCYCCCSAVLARFTALTWPMQKSTLPSRIFPYMPQFPCHLRFEVPCFSPLLQAIDFQVLNQLERTTAANIRCLPPKP